MPEKIEGVVSLERFKNILELLPLTRDWNSRAILYALAIRLAKKLSADEKLLLDVVSAYLRGPVMVRLRVVYNQVVEPDVACEAMVRVNEDIAQKWYNGSIPFILRNSAITESRLFEGDPRHCSLCKKRNDNLKEGE